jgi:ABC-2 type transport system permease protein
MKPRFRAIVWKELLHILRDPRSLVIVFLWPMLMVFIYGFAINFNLREIKLGLLDQDRSAQSRDFVRGLTAAGYFRISKTMDDRRDVKDDMIEGQFMALLVIPSGFGRSLKRGPSAPIQLLVDGSNANISAMAVNTLRSYCAARTIELNSGISNLPLSVEPRIWYNPEMKSADFIVPGLAAVVMMMICALLTSITLAREREHGTLEQILVSPVRPSEIVAGKLTPYIILALADSTLVILFSMFVFGVPFRGDAIMLLIASLAFVTCALGIGLLISSRARTQQVAMMASMVMTFLPSFLLSGFIFPIASFPKFLQAITYLVPARYFLVIIRGVMLKDIGWGTAFRPLLFLVLFGTVVMLASVRRFKIRLEE